MKKTTIWHLSYVTKEDGEANVPYREVNKEQFGNEPVKFAPYDYDDEEAIWDEDIYAYVDQHAFYNYDDEEFEKYVIENYD